MDALTQARHLHALAATPKPPEGGGRGGKTSAATLRASQEDTCDMPTLGGPCPLPGDHDGECEPVPPKCRCSHSAWRHVSERGRCRRAGCGCTTYRGGAV